MQCRQQEKVEEKILEFIWLSHIIAKLQGNKFSCFLPPNIKKSIKDSTKNRESRNAKISSEIGSNGGRIKGGTWYLEWIESVPEVSYKRILCLMVVTSKDPATSLSEKTTRRQIWTSSLCISKNSDEYLEVPCSLNRFHLIEIWKSGERKQHYNSLYWEIMQMQIMI